MVADTLIAWGRCPTRTRGTWEPLVAAGDTAAGSRLPVRTRANSGRAARFRASGETTRGVAPRGPPAGVAHFDAITRMTYPSRRGHTPRPPREEAIMSDPTVLPSSYDRAPVGGLDRRVAVRYPGNPDASCQAITSPAGILPAWVRDISAVGVALLINREFATGTVLTIELSNPIRGVACLLRARVVHTLEL